MCERQTSDAIIDAASRLEGTAAESGISLKELSEPEKLLERIRKRGWVTKMKPILFNTEMVRAILDGRKTATRRVVKSLIGKIECSRGSDHEFVWDDFNGQNPPRTGFVCRKCGLGVSGPRSRYGVGNSWIRPPYSHGDILYARETWGDCRECEPDGAGYYLYRADYPDGAITTTHPDGVVFGLPRWHPSIHMPREAARIFLRVKDVRVERLQNITVEEIIREGLDVEPPPICRNTEPTDAQKKKYRKMAPAEQEEYIKNRARHTYMGWCKYADDLFTAWEKLWDSTIKPADLSLYGWAANPWVWVIEFERVEKPKEG